MKSMSIIIILLATQVFPSCITFLGLFPLIMAVIVWSLFYIRHFCTNVIFFINSYPCCRLGSLLLSSEDGITKASITVSRCAAFINNKLFRSALIKSVAKTAPIPASIYHCIYRRARDIGFLF